MQIFTKIKFWIWSKIPSMKVTRKYRYFKIEINCDDISWLMSDLEDLERIHQQDKTQRFRSIRLLKELKWKVPVNGLVEHPLSFGNVHFLIDS